MSTYVLMRILESAPQRYERGMRLLTLGRIDRAYDALAGRVEAGQAVLDLGCGTGALTRRMASRGARVKGIDVNPEMLAIARRRVADDGLDGAVELQEAGVADLDAEGDDAYDVVTAGLCFSELSDDELTYALAQVTRILRPAGTLLVADEVRPAHLVQRVLAAVLRAPLTALTYLLTQQTTHAVRDLPARLDAAGLALVAHETRGLGTFATFVARARGGSP
jgi:demethylmenaquinone methyltransferase/2-methoxy-6-polyprenyl-1,4-benzoquinol methylase